MPPTLKNNAPAALYYTPNCGDSSSLHGERPPPQRILPLGRRGLGLLGTTWYMDHGAVAVLHIYHQTHIFLIITSSNKKRFLTALVN